MSCRVHEEEPCGEACTASCRREWHYRPEFKDGLCRECYEDRATAEGNERAAAAQTAYACGYYD